MCYEWEWFQRRRAAAPAKREEPKTASERTPMNDQGESVLPPAKPAEVPQRAQEELEPV